MKKLYIANDLIEARLLDSILKSHGLSSVVRNESLQGGIGELLENSTQSFFILFEDLNVVIQKANSPHPKGGNEHQ